MSDKYSSLDHETLRTMIRGKDRRIRELEEERRKDKEAFDAFYATLKKYGYETSNDLVDRNIELEQRLVAMEANMPKSAINLERENFALRERLAAVEGLPVRVRERMDKWALRINVENGRMVPPNPNQDGEWITVRMAHKMITDELQAALHPKAQNAEDCAG